MQALCKVLPSVARRGACFANQIRRFGGEDIWLLWFLVEFTFKPAEGEEVEIECDANENLLEVAQSNDVEIKSIVYSPIFI